MFRFRNFGIAYRLVAAFACILVILGAVASVGVWRLQQVAEATRQLGAVETEKLTLAIRWRALVDLNWARTQAAARDPDSSRLALWQQEMDKSSDDFQAEQKRLRQLVKGGSGEPLVARIDETRESYRLARGAVLKRKVAGEDIAAALDSELKPKSLAFIAAIGALADHQQAEVGAALARAESSAGAGVALLGAGGASALALSILFVWLLARSIVTPLQQAANSAHRMATGDLSESIVVDGRDEACAVLSALKEMQSSLSGVVSGVRMGSESVATASAEIAQGNNDLSQRTEQQASALQQTAASMEELTATVRQNADNARQASQLALSARGVAIEGGSVVGQVVQTMKGIDDGSRRIAEIIGVIDGIAFQTNILALNAAVEAARAGEQGRGFAVVASEVRSLAQRSAEAAKQIKSLITDSVERAQAGTALVDRAGATMNEVVASIKKVTDIVAEISTASSEQSAGMAQVDQALSQMDQATQQNAALVEQSAAAAESLRQQSQQLVLAVSVFRTTP